MRYTVRKSLVWIVGHIWMPPDLICSQVLTLSQYDIETIKAQALHDTGSDAITCDAVRQWLTAHAGDFSSVIDFSASIEDGKDTVDIPWSTEAGEMQYHDTLNDNIEGE